MWPGNAKGFHTWEKGGPPSPIPTAAEGAGGPMGSGVARLRPESGPSFLPSVRESGIEGLRSSFFLCPSP